MDFSKQLQEITETEIEKPKENNYYEESINELTPLYNEVFFQLKECLLGAAKKGYIEKNNEKRIIPASIRFYQDNVPSNVSMKIYIESGFGNTLYASYDERYNRWSGGKSEFSSIGGYYDKSRKSRQMVDFLVQSKTYYRDARSITDKIFNRRPSLKNYACGHDYVQNEKNVNYFISLLNNYFDGSVKVVSVQTSKSFHRVRDSEYYSINFNLSAEY